MNQVTLILAFSAFALSNIASAKSDEAVAGNQALPSQAMSEIQQIKQQMAEMERRHDAEIAALRNENGDKWLTQQRADEIREVVKDVLADSQTRTSLQGEGVTAGWNKNFFLASPDGNFTLFVTGQIQARQSYNYQSTSSRNPLKVGAATTYPKESSSNEYGTEIRRARIIFTGNVIDPSWTYKVAVAFNQNSLVEGSATTNNSQNSTNGVVLDEAFIRKDFGNGFAARTGQWKSAYNFEEMASSTSMQFVERTLVNQYFTPKFIAGIELQYETALWRASVNWNDGGGNRNVSGVGSSSTSENNVQWATSGRAELKLAGEWGQFREMMSFRGREDGILIGAAYNWQRGGAGNVPTSAGVSGPIVGNDDGINFSYTADFNLRSNGFSFFAAFLGNSFYSRPDGADAVNSLGAVVQGGFFLSDDIEITARWEWLNVSGGAYSVVSSGNTPIPATSPNALGSALNAQHFSVYTVGANYYISGNRVKLNADVGYVAGAIMFSTGLFNQNIIGADYRTDQNSSATGQVVARIQMQLLF